MHENFSSSIETIQSEYRRIDRKWLLIQYRLLLWMAAFTPLAEVWAFFLMRRLGSTEVPFPVFLLKHVLAVLLCNGAVVAAATFCMRGRLSQRKKIYGLSLMTVAMAFSVYTFHSAFYALYVIFAIPMVLTVIYGDRHLTTLISALCLICKAVPDLLFFRGPSRPSVLSSAAALTDFCVSLLLMVLFYVVCRLLLRTEQAKNNVSLNLEQERLRYQMQSLTDALTQVGNRLALRTAFQTMEERQHQSVFYLAMLDLDAFKLLNDTYGHHQGDQYLRTLGLLLLNLSTPQIQAFRFGGDEFCLLFSDLDVTQVRDLCRNLQEEFARSDLHRRFQPVTISIGITQYHPGEKSSALLERADMALYRAKQERGSIAFCE